MLHWASQHSGVGRSGRSTESQDLQSKARESNEVYKQRLGEPR